jgi:hypothetical protein
MQYQEAVAEFRNLDESIESGQWRQAQITWDQITSGVSQVRWAQDIGKGRRHVQVLYKVWDRWQVAAGRPAFAEAYRTAETDAESPEEATTIKDANRAASALDKLGPVVKAGIIREHLADPKVAREVFNAPQPDDETAAKARMHAGNAITDHDQRIAEHLEDKRHGEAVAEGRSDLEGLYEVATMMSALAAVVVAGGKLARRLSTGATLSDRMRQSLAGQATKAKATIEWLEGIEHEQAGEDINEVLRVWAAES